MSDDVRTAQSDAGAGYLAGLAHAPRTILHHEIDGHKLAFIPSAPDDDTNGAEYQIEDLAQYQARPPRLVQQVNLRTPQSFVEYLAYFGNGNTSIIFSDRDKRQFLAVIDYHDAQNQPARLTHRALCQLVHPLAWAQWTARNGNAKKFTQEDFAQFVEDHIPEIAVPDGATLLEMVRNFEARKDVTFQSSTRASDGNVLFTFNEIVTGGSQTTGKMSMPAELKLVLTPFDGGMAYPVTARMRWRLESGGKLSLWYDLLRVDEILDLAFEEQRQFIKNGTVGNVRGILHGSLG